MFGSHGRMKKNIFEQYVKAINSLFSITEEELFTKSKRKDLTDARFLLYYLCYNRPMKIRYIQDYMANKGYDISHSSVIHGINQVSEKVENDSDYHNLVNTLNNV